MAQKDSSSLLPTIPPSAVMEVPQAREKPSTLLLDAVLGRYIERVKELMRDPKVDPNEKVFGQLPLIRATVHKSAKIVELLAQNKLIEVDACEDGSPNTALWYAVYMNNCRLAKLLRNAGANSDIRGKNGMSPREMANYKNNLDMIKIVT